MKCWIIWGFILLVSCSTRSEPPRASIPERCSMMIGVDCNERNADVVVTGEVVIRADGVSRLLRVTDVSPADHPLRLKAIAAAERPGQYFNDGRGETIVEQFPYCQRPFVDVIASGACPSRAHLEQQMWTQGYRLRSVETTSGVKRYR